MELRSLEGFEAHLTEELKWRTQELDTWKRVIAKARDHEKVGLLRAGVALLYCHWEGYIKEAARSYLEYVNYKPLRLSDLRPELMAVAMRTVLGRGEMSKTSTAHTDIVLQFRAAEDTPAWLPHERSTIRTRSNLSYGVFEDIMHSIGCDPSTYEIHRSLIDNRLLKQRNDIAHGKHLNVEETDWDEMHERVLKILHGVRTDLQNAAATESYKVPSSSVQQ